MRRRDFVAGLMIASAMRHVGTHPDLIFATTAGLALAFRLAATEIPIVTVSAGPVFLGLVPRVTDSRC